MACKSGLGRTGVADFAGATRATAGSSDMYRSVRVCGSYVTRWRSSHEMVPRYAHLAR
jgi:hypothetical protein